MSRPVLFEAEMQNDFMYGYTDNYIRVKTAFNPELTNRIVDCKIKSIYPESIAEVELLNLS